MLAKLTVDKVSLARAAKPVFGPPVELATYSTMLHDDGRQGTPTDASVDPTVDRYLVREPYFRSLCPDSNANHMNLQLQAFPYDLKRGYGTQIEKRNDNECMSLLLECLEQKQLIGQSEFVCFRNLLTTLSSTPYDIAGKFDYGMIVVVQKIKDVHYMFEFPTEEALNHQAKLTDGDKQMSYWGLKFGSYVRAKPGQQTPLSVGPLDYNSEFCTVVKTTVGGHSILLRGEIDCSGGRGYMELKTNKEMDSDGHLMRTFKRHKLIKWWLQSSFVGVKEVMCGFRDKKGIVSGVKTYSVAKLPSQMLDRKPSTCLAFLDSFLSFVKANVATEYVPHVFRRKAEIPEFELTVDNDGKYKFIPFWFAQ